MKVGISSWSYPWSIGISGREPEKPMNEQILLQKAIELNAQVLQFSDNFPLHLLQDNELGSLKDNANAANILIETGTSGVSIDHLRNYIEISKELSSPILRTLLHDPKNTPELSIARKNIEKLVPFLEENSVTLAIENHDFYYLKEIAEIVENINSPNVRVCLDPVNNLGLGESLDETLHALAKYTVSFHCKDYTITRKPSKMGFDVVGAPLGTGLLDMELCYQLLDDQISYVVELWTPWQGNIVDTIAIEELWAKGSMDYLLEFQSLHLG
jgi:sugar phosphate isomerase/epimerase